MGLRPALNLTGVLGDGRVVLRLQRIVRGRQLPRSINGSRLLGANIRQRLTSDRMRLLLILMRRHQVRVTRHPCIHRLTRLNQLLIQRLLLAHER